MWFPHRKTLGLYRLISAADAVWRDCCVPCRFCLGSNKVLRVALGHDDTDEYRPSLARLSDNISGSVGLFFTRLPHDEVISSVPGTIQLP